MLYRLCLFFLVFPLASCLSVQSEWRKDTLGMKREVQRYKKDALMLFTGSDWEPISQNILKSEEYKKVLVKYEKNFLFYNIDIVRDEDAMPTKTLKRNYILFSQYYVNEPSHIIVRSFEGDVYFSKKLGKDDSLLNVLKEVVEKKAYLKKIKQRIAHSSGKDLTIAIDEFFSSIYNAENEAYDSLREKAIKADAKNESGLLSKFKIIVASLKADRLTVQKQYLLAADEYILLLKEEGLDKDEKQNAWYQIAYLYALSKKIDNEKILFCLNQAIKASPDSKGVARLKEIINAIEKKE